MDVTSFRNLFYFYPTKDFMHKFTDTTDEQRLKALNVYNLVDIKVDFSYILQSLLAICDVAYSSIVALYENEFIVIESAGFDTDKTFKREGSCSEYIRTRNKFCELPNVNEVEEIDCLGKVINDFNIVFSAGCPIVDPDGVSIGVLNILDSKTKVLTEKQKYFVTKASERIAEIFIQNRQRERLQYFDTMFTKSKDMIGIVSDDGVIIKTNPAFSEITGYSKEEILTNNIIEFIHPDSYPKGFELKAHLLSHSSFLNSTLQLITKDKKLKWIEWNATYEKNTGLLYFIGRDTSEVMEQSILLQNSETRFRGFFENSQSIMCMHDLQGILTAVNKEAAAMIGYPTETFIGKDFASYIPVDRREFFNLYLEKLRETGAASGHAQIVRKDGSRRIWMYNSIVEKNNEGEAYVIANGVDFTERFQMEEELKIATKTAEEANRAKSEFIANMSHEIRTPLNGIIGFTDLVLKTHMDDTQKQYLKIINESGTTLLSIVDQILDFSKIESRKITLNKEKIDLQNLASDACAMVSFASEKKGLEMLLDFQEDLPRYIWVDETRLKQVLVNLLSNAVKFTEKGEVKLSITLNKELSNNDIILHFKVSDTGIGISADKMDKIFRAFVQEDGSITKKYGGTGLGLTISNRLLELMDSKLKVVSNQGKGSQFSFDLQLKVERDTFDDELLKSIKKILVVDDNDSNRQILKRMLELKNIEVDEADSGLTALLMLQKNAQYDVIIMDYHMPVMDGIETIRKIKGDIIKKDSLDQPVVMLYSSSDSNKLQADCDELEVQSRLVKPIKMQEMYEVLARLKDKKTQAELKKEKEQKQERYLKEQDRPLECESTILIVEDNEINLYLTNILVGQIMPNSIILEAKDGVEAVSLFSKYNPDLVLMDIQMPNMNGLEATEKIRSMEKGVLTPIIALTAGNMVGEKEKCLSIGMNDFMVKPFVKNDLSLLLRKWLTPVSSDPVPVENEGVALDVEHLNERWFNQYSSVDPDFRAIFGKMAIKGVEESAQALKKAVHEKDIKLINAIGHKLKGTSLAVGLTQLSKLSIAFELIEAYDEKYLDFLMQSLIEEIKIVEIILNKSSYE